MSFIYSSNRAVQVVDAALGPLGGQNWRAGMPSIDLLYFDTYGGKQLQEQVSIGKQLMLRANTAPLDRKHLLAKRLMEAGITTPRHYFSPEQVPDEPDTLWYVKAGDGTGGKEMWVCRASDIPAYFKPGYLIQEAITNIALFNEKKFTMRVYVLVYHNMVYWYPEGFLVLHARSYDREALDSRIHFNHSGYMDRLSDVQLLPTRYYGGFKALEPALAALLHQVFALFDATLDEKLNGSNYCLFGVDLLALPGNKVALVEINDRPSFTHTAQINQTVNTPMVQAMSAVLIPELIQPGLKREALRFEELGFFE